MKQKRLILVVALLCIFTSNSMAQTDSCGFDRIRTYLRSLDSLHFDAKEGAHTARIQYYREHPRPLQQVNHGYYQPMSNGLYPMLVVPVAVHVFHAAADNTVGTGTNISQAQIDNQLTALNDAFDTLGIQFCVVAVTRHNDNGVNQKVDSQLQVTSLSSVVYYNPDSVLNLYVVRSILENNNTESTLAGYNNSLPGVGRIDAVVVRYNRFGNYNTCSGCPLSTDARGITTVHEVGHYLGLWHTFQDACNGGLDSTDCAHKGDRCCDTPPHIQPSASGCSTSPNTCSETYSGNLADPKNNYMNYTGEDCMNHFTPDQLNIMMSLLNGPRAVLVSPGNLNRWGNTCVNGSAFFGYDKSFLCSADTVHFTAYQQTGAQYKWNVYSDSVTYNGTFGNNYTFNYILTKQTSYTLSLTVIFGTDTITFTDSNAVTLAGCGIPITSEQGNWYFGEYAGLKFNTMMPVSDNEPKIRAPLNINTDEGTISQSNTQGQLLFYGGGEAEIYNSGGFLFPVGGIFRIYDKNYSEMPNSPIIGSYTSVQSAVVVPHPTNGKKFYVFTVHGDDANKYLFSNVPSDDKRGFRYSVIDTFLNDVDTNFKDIPVQVPISGHEYCFYDSAMVTGEMVTAIPKCNGTDYWILVKGGVSTGFHYDRLMVFSLDSTGVSYHSHEDSIFNVSGGGLIKASPNGLFLATLNKVIEFDKKTGTIGKVRAKTTADTYSFSFSPDSRLFYQFENYKLYQYNLYSSNLIATKVEVYNSGSSNTRQIQIGPDNKVYVSNNGLDFLNVINFPDSVSDNLNKNKCGFLYKGPSLGKNGIGGSCKGGLPNLVNAKKQEDIPLEIFTIDSACNIIKFYSTECCDSIYFWDFGDSTFTSEKNPTHTYAVNGTYNVTLYTSNNILYKTITIGIDEPVISGDTLAKCDTTKTHLFSCSNQNNYYSYEWSVNSGNLITVNYLNIAEVRLTVNGSIKLIAHNKATGCKDSSVVQISVLPILYNSIDTPVAGCQNDTPDVIIGFSPTGGYGSGSYTYKWYVSTDTGMVKTWSLISGATDSSYQPGVNSAQRWFKRVVTSGTCEIESNVSYTTFTILSNTIARDTSDCDDITGSTPITSSTFSYSWQRSFDNSNWTSISSQTGKDLTAPVYFRTTYVRRVVQDSLCTSYSNVLTIQPSITTTLTTTEDTICYGEALLVTGSTPCSDNSSITYQWQYKTSPSGDFGNIPVYYDSDNASLDEDWHFECELRRIAISAGDTMLSDTVAVYFKRLDNYIMSFEGFEPYRYAICSGSSTPGLVGSTICEYGAWEFAWQSTTDTTDENSWQYEAGTPSFTPSVNTFTKYYRRKTKHLTLLDSSYTPAFQVYVRNPQIITQPGNATLNEGVNTSFHTVCLDLEPVKWQYGKVVGGSVVWTDLTAGGLTIPDPFVPYQYTFDLLIPAELCLDGASFRAVYQNPCQSPGTYTYSNEVTLAVNAVSYDVWARDYSTDTGNEPSTVSNTYIWDSPDIWNSRSTGITYHQNPEYRISDPNYIHAIVRNKGAATSIPAKLYLYWTFASTGERWDRHWLNDTTLSSTYGNWRTYYSAKKPLGGLIGVYNVPTITSGNSWQMEAVWYAPNPGVLTGDSNTTSAELCFLARIVTCSTPDYGLTYPETYYTRPNVERNNNLVTKNFIVVDSLAGNGKTHWNGNGNPTDVSATGRLVFTARDCDYFEYGTVTVHLDNELQTLWVGNGANGSGFTLINDSTLQMDSCVMTLDDIAYGAETRSLYGIQFNERDDLIILENVDEYFEFDVQQYLTEESEENSIGGILYGVPVVLSPPEISGSQRRNTPVQDTKAYQLAFSAFPNPFNDVLKVVYSLPKDESVTITLTNLLGQTIQTVEQNEFKTAGIHRLDINTANLTEGIYFITFKAGNEIKQKKIVLIR